MELHVETRSADTDMDVGEATNPVDAQLRSHSHKNDWEILLLITWMTSMRLKLTLVYLRRENDPT
jgi:hypothetical protein